MSSCQAWPLQANALLRACIPFLSPTKVRIVKANVDAPAGIGVVRGHVHRFPTFVALQFLSETMTAAGEMSKEPGPLHSSLNTLNLIEDTREGTQYQSTFHHVIRYRTRLER